ncbi:MAG: YceI family protein [Ardenticatenaceae bacterium]|nr:YceI family protein [Anaerolineales bacterium]MCB9009966.1 YceI family protein [Ardenticatenaceae bacterium]
MKNVMYQSKLKPPHTQKNILYSLMLFGMGAIVGGFAGVFIFMYITGGSAQPSEPISAPRLSLESSNSESQTIESAAGTNLSTPPHAEMNETMIDPETAIGSESNGETTTSSGADVAAVPETTILSPQLFRIVSEESEARFSVYETFPEGTAVGRTNQIAGDMIVDFNNPSNSQLGTIRINLRTLQTDDPDRDRSIRCCVLLTAQPEYEFSDFVPTSFSGLPSQVELGQTITFQVTGDLTLRGVTRSITFDVNLTVIDADTLRGFATTTVNRTDFSILNDADNGFDYHGVEESVTLEFDFVARSVPE